MKHVTFTLSTVLLAADDADLFTLESRLAGALFDLNPTLENATVEEIGHPGRPTIAPARPGTCRVGPHPFHAPHRFPASQPVPDICPDHAREAEDHEVAELHRPLFEEVTRLTGLTPLIWHSGGGCMTIVIPLSTPEPGQGWSAPCYMGLEEGQDEHGRWFGSVSFYETEDAAYDGDGADVVDASNTNPQHPHQWAAQIAAHYRARTGHTGPDVDPAQSQ